MSSAARSSSGISQYKALPFDPWLVVGQIVFCTASQYTILGLGSGVLGGLFGLSGLWADVLTFEVVSPFNAMGCLVIALTWLTSAASCVALLFAVQRSRLCLDFASTAAVIQVLVTSIMSSGSDVPFPGRVSWWVVWLIGLIITVSGSEYLCRIKEMTPIPIKQDRGGRKRSRRKGSRLLPVSPTAHHAGGEQEDESLEMLPLNVTG